MTAALTAALCTAHGIMATTGVTLLVMASWLARRQYAHRAPYSSLTVFDLARGCQAIGLWWLGVALTSLRDPMVLAQAWPHGGAFSVATLLYLLGVGGGLILFCTWQVGATYQHHVWTRANGR